MNIKIFSLVLKRDTFMPFACRYDCNGIRRFKFYECVFKEVTTHKSRSVLPTTTSFLQIFCAASVESKFLISVMLLFFYFSSVFDS